MSVVDPAPDSPRIRRWNRRILGWGCAPAMAIGLVGGVVTTARPELAQTMAALGTGIAILVGGPITVHAWRLRRDNRRRWRAAQGEALESGMKVKVVETRDGDHEYRLVEREVIAPLRWGEEGRDGGGGEPAGPGGSNEESAAANDESDRDAASPRTPRPPAG